MTYGTDRQGSVPPYSIARQFYSPRPPHTRLRLRSGVGVGLGELARLKRGYGKVAFTNTN